MSAIHNVRAFAARWRWSLGVTRARAGNRWWDLVGYAAGFCMETTWQAERATYSPGHKSWRCWVLRKAHAGPHRTGTYRWATGGEPIYDPLAVNLLRSGPEPGRAPRWLSGRHRDVGTRRRDRLAVQVAFERLRASARAAQAAEQAARPMPSWGFGGASLREALEAAGEIAEAVRVERVVMPEGPAYFGPSPDVHDQGPILGELGVLPLTGDLTDDELADLAASARSEPDRFRITAYEVDRDGTRREIRHDWHVHGPRAGQDPEHWDEQGKLGKGNDA